MHRYLARGPTGQLRPSWKSIRLLLVLLAGCALEVTDAPSSEPEDLASRGTPAEEEPELGTRQQGLTLDEFCPIGTAMGDASMPHCTIHNIDTMKRLVNRAIIVVHGSERDGVNAFSGMSSRAQTALTKDRVDVVAPNFVLAKDVSDLNLAAEVPYWTESWQYGAPSENYPTLSSFDVLDNLLRKLSSTRPNLQHVVVVGISAGARLVSRWATAMDMSALRSGVTISFWSMGAGNYMFTGTWRPYASVENCPGNDAWNYPWGVENRQAYPYINRLQSSSLRENESRRMIYWSVGADDVDDLKPEKCFQTQGAHRRERWLHHRTAVWNECQTIASVSECGDRRQVWQRSIEIPSCGHSLTCAADKAAGRNLLFAKLAFSSSARVPGMPFCEPIVESEDKAGTWTDNWLCSNIDMGLRWSSAGPIPGMQCTQVNEPAEPPSTTWNDNYICLPTPQAGFNNIPLRWSHNGRPDDRRQCVQFDESADYAHTWHDNWLCW
jgi:hypothetical protein